MKENKVLIYYLGLFAYIYIILVNVMEIIQTYIISIGFANYIFTNMKFTFYPVSVAHAIGVIFSVFTSFIGHTYFTFKEMK